MDGFWEEKSAPETSHLTFSGPIGLCSKIPDFVHWEVSARRLFTNIGYILLAGRPIDPILFHCIRNFKGIISMLLVGVFFTLL
jgi:hypothetical protein